MRRSLRCVGSWLYLQINAMALDKESFWVKANEQKFEADAILKELMENFSTKAPGNMTWPVRISPAPPLPYLACHL